MKRILLIIIILGSALASAHAQYFFNKRETLHSFASTLNSVLEKNGKYYCSGVCWDSINYAGGGTAYYRIGIRFIVFDQMGAVLRDTFYQTSSGSIYATHGKLHVESDNTFLLAAYYEDTSVNHIRSLLVARFDTGGHLLWRGDYAKPFCTNATQYDLEMVDFEPVGNKEWLMLSSMKCNTTLNVEQMDFLLTKLDSNFNVIWHKQYGDGLYSDYAGKLLIEPDGYLLAGGRNNDNITNSGYSYRAELIKTDTSGAVKWSWLSDPAKLTGPIQDIVRTPDSGYVFCGQGNGVEITGGSSSDVEWRGWAQKLNANKDTVWSKEIGVGPSNIYANLQTNIRLHSDGNIIVSGVIAGGYNLNDTFDLSFGSLVKLSNVDGSYIWKKKYQYPNDTLLYRVYDMKPTADGGFVLVGEATDMLFPQTAPTQRGWIVKVDSNGCLGNNDPQCWKVGISEVQQAAPEFSLYPNPAQDILLVRTTLQSANMVLVLSDITGKTLIRQPVGNGTAISIGSLQPGMYLYQITVDGLSRQKGKVLRQ